MLQLVKKISFVLILITALISGKSLYGQEKVVSSGGNSISPFGGKVETNTKLTEIAYRKKLIGTCYLKEEWEKTDILLSHGDKVLKEVATKIDLRHNLLVLKTKNDTLVLPTYRIKSIYFKDSKEFYITESVVKSELKGFYKVLVDGEYSLLSKSEVKFQPANYNVALNTGSRDDKIVKKEVFYLFGNDRLVKLESRKRKFRKQFENESLLNFFESHKVMPSKKSFLMDFTHYLNEAKLSI